MKWYSEIFDGWRFHLNCPYMHQNSGEGENFWWLKLFHFKILLHHLHGCICLHYDIYKLNTYKFMQRRFKGEKKKNKKGEHQVIFRFLEIK